MKRYVRARRPEKSIVEFAYFKGLSELIGVEDGQRTDGVGASERMF